MRDAKSSKKREGAFHKERLPSFFLAGTVLLLLFPSCKSLETTPEVDWEAERSKKQLQRIQKERRLAFAVIKDAREEKKLILFAEKAASLLGLKLLLYRVEKEELTTLLRSKRADFAFGAYSGREEIQSLYLQPLVIKGKEKNYFFAMARQGKILQEMLEEALKTAILRGEADEPFRTESQ